MAPSPERLPRLGGSGWANLLALTAASIAAGMWSVAGAAATQFAALLFPPALGMPAFIPPLRFAPLGETTTTVWAIDLVGAIVMLVTAVLWARAANRKHPYPSRGRAFGRGLWVTIVAVVLGNVVRSVGQSFVLRSDLPTFGGQLLTNVVVSALTGLVLGLIVGLIAMLFAPRRPSSVDSPDSRD